MINFKKLEAHYRALLQGDFTGDDIRCIQEDLILLMAPLTDEQRYEVMSNFCTHCGSKNPNCQCWNDE